MKPRKKLLVKVSTRRNLPTIKAKPKLVVPVQSELARAVPWIAYVRTSCGTWELNGNFIGARVLKASGAKNPGWENRVRNANTHPDLRRSHPTKGIGCGHLVKGHGDIANTERFSYAPTLENL